MRQPRPFSGCSTTVPMTGGQLMAEAERRLGAYWSMTRSQVYRELPALAEMGYVKLGKPGARSSQPYAITPAGKRAFTRWLAEDPGHEAVRNPIALRAAFGAYQSAAALTRPTPRRPTITRRRSPRSARRPRR